MCASSSLPSIRHSYWISHPESLGRWGKSLFLNLLWSLEFKYLSGKRNVPLTRQRKIKETPGGSWQEVNAPQLCSPHWVVLGLDFGGRQADSECYLKGFPITEFKRPLVSLSFHDKAISLDWIVKFWKPATGSSQWRTGWLNCCWGSEHTFSFSRDVSCWWFSRLIPLVVGKGRFIFSIFWCWKMAGNRQRYNAPTIRKSVQAVWVGKGTGERCTLLSRKQKQSGQRVSPYHKGTD